MGTCAQLRGYDYVGAPVAQTFLDVLLGDVDASSGSPGSHQSTAVNDDQ